MVALIITTNGKPTVEEYCVQKEHKTLFKKYMTIELKKNETAFFFNSEGDYIYHGARPIKIPKTIL